MRILICGDRNLTDYNLIRQTLTQVLDKTRKTVPMDFFTVIHGAARGADTLGAEAAVNLNILAIGYPANWAKYGKAAGVKRNQQMLDEGKPDLVLAFHDNLSN